MNVWKRYSSRFFLLMWPAHAQKGISLRIPWDDERDRVHKAKQLQ